MVASLNGMGEHARVSSHSELDLRLLSEVARGERSALGELYDRYAPNMLALGMRMLKSRSESEDVLQDVFLELWKRAGDYDPRRGRVKTWIMLRMRSRCLDQLKSPRLKRSRSLDLMGPERSMVEAQAEAAVDNANLRRAVASLPDTQREVLVLGYFEGLSSSEIGARLNIPVGTVKSRIRAAMNGLRTAFSADGLVK